MTEKRFTKEEQSYLNKTLRHQFCNYYRIAREDMSLSERLLFEDIARLVQNGFAFDIWFSRFVK